MVNPIFESRYQHSLITRGGNFNFPNRIREVSQGKSAVPNHRGQGGSLNVGKLNTEGKRFQVSEQLWREGIPRTIGKVLLSFSDMLQNKLVRGIEGRNVAEFTVSNTIVQNNGSSETCTKIPQKTNRFIVALEGKSPSNFIRTRPKMDTKIFDVVLKARIFQLWIRSEQHIFYQGTIVVTDSEELSFVSVDFESRESGDHIKQLAHQGPNIDEVLTRESKVITHTKQGYLMGPKSGCNPS